MPGMSVKKILEILDAFTFEASELTVPQIADMLNQPQSSVYRNLRMLKQFGYVMEANTGTYRLGYRFLEKAQIVKQDTNLTTIAMPIMRKLTAGTDETSILAAISELYSVCLGVVSSRQPVKVTAQQGQLMVLYGGASSKALLAYMPESTVDELFRNGAVKRHADGSIIDADKLKRNLQEVRARGYAVSDSEIDEGVMAYAVPVRDASQQVIASLTIAGPRERVQSKNGDELVAKLLEAQRELQRYLV